MPFTQKLLSFTFDMANGDRVTVSGLRAAATVTMGGGADYDRIKGQICPLIEPRPGLQGNPAKAARCSQTKASAPYGNSDAPAPAT
jgi:hypothetical protein